jgi:CrcB protein
MLLLMLGGALGTSARYWLGKWIGEQSWAEGFPYGTFVINVTGSFILGIVGAVVIDRMPEHQDWYLLLGTGFCGGYTTFSTFEWETYRLVRDGSWWLALGNVLGSVLVGFIGVVLGVALVAIVMPKS